MINVLIAVHPASMADLVRENLERNGIQPTVAGDGLVAKNAFLEQAFDCVILSHELPELNGLELCREVRKSRSDVALIVMTSSSLDSAISMEYEQLQVTAMTADASFAALLVDTLQRTKSRSVGAPHFRRSSAVADEKPPEQYDSRRD